MCSRIVGLFKISLEYFTDITIEFRVDETRRHLSTIGIDKIQKRTNRTIVQ